MHYENRQAPEGANVTPHNPVYYLVKLLVVAVVIIVILVFLLNYFGSRLARSVPFKVEQEVMSLVDNPFGDAAVSPQLQEYLITLADTLAANMPIPEGMEMLVHYDKADEFNAYATLGGNVVFYRGLLQNMPHENALAMVVAHEISHVLHRDPIAGLGGGVPSMLALAALTGAAGGGAAAKLLSKTGTITQMGFSRQMESEADRAALEAIYRTYGHVAGADELFRVLQSEKDSKGESWTSSFSSTHPQDASRIEAIANIALENEWVTSGPLTPLPLEFSSWLAGASQ